MTLVNHPRPHATRRLSQFNKQFNRLIALPGSARKRENRAIYPLSHSDSYKRLISQTLYFDSVTNALGGFAAVLPLPAQKLPCLHKNSLCRFARGPRLACRLLLLTNSNSYLKSLNVLLGGSYRHGRPQPICRLLNVSIDICLNTSLKLRRMENKAFREAYKAAANELK